MLGQNLNIDWRGREQMQKAKDLSRVQKEITGRLRIWGNRVLNSLLEFCITLRFDCESSVAPLRLDLGRLKIMVGVAQLVEHPVVVRDVAGSSPVAHPNHVLEKLHLEPR